MNLPSADGEFTLTDDLIRAFVERYPFLDVPKELRAINLWLHRNPSRRWSKPLLGIDRWLKTSAKNNKPQKLHLVNGKLSESELLELGRKLNLEPRAGESWEKFAKRVRDKSA